VTLCSGVLYKGYRILLFLMYLSFQAAKILKPNKSVLPFHSNMTEHICKGLIQAHIF